MADLAVVAANVLPDGTTIAYTIEDGIVDVPDGVTIEAGEAVYKDTSLGTIHRLSRSVPPSSILYVGITANHARPGQTISFFRGPADINLGVTLTVATELVASVNGGKIAPYADLATGAYIHKLGYARTTTLLRFNPEVTGVVFP